MPHLFDHFRLKSQRKLPAVMALLLGLGLFLPSTLAQTSATGALTVTATDASGAVIPDAKLSIVNDAGLTRTGTTNSAGNYTFSLLPPGNYKLSISAVGFRTLDVPSVAVHVTETETLTETLQVGEQQQQVQVTSQVETIQTETSTLGAVVNTRSINELPLATRNYTQLLSLSAGVVANVNDASSLGRGGQTFYTNGSDDVSNSYLMDGVNISNYASSTTQDAYSFYGTISVPSADALQEFKVQTSNYDASYGRNTGASVNVVTKSGTNSIHGSLFEFFRNDDLNANTFFRNSTRQPRGVLKQNQFGGAFGGPIRKDKLFFFLSYQGTRQLNGIAPQGSSGVTLPATLTDNRSAAPLGSAFCPGNNPTGSPGFKYSHTFLGGAPTYPNNQVNCDGSNINPIALALLNAKLPNGTFVIPTPQTILNSGTSSAVGFSSFSIPAAFNEDQALFDVDYVISSKHSLALKYFYSFGTQNSPFGITAGEPPGGGNSSLSGNANYIAKVTSLLSNNIVNEGRFSIYYIRAELTPGDPLRAPALGVTPNYSGDLVMPVIAMTGLFSFGGSPVDGNRTPQLNFEWSDQLSWTHGPHTFRFGFDESRVNWDICSCGKTRGTLSFQTWSDFLLGQSAAQNGTPDSNLFATSASAQPSTEPNLLRENNLSAFAQDDYKVNQRLTLNLGVRWEYDGTAHDALSIGGTNPVFALFETVPIPPASGTYVGYTVAQDYQGPVPDGVIRRSTDLLTYGHAPFTNFAPRVGFAWQPIKSGRLVLRGGYGIFYQTIPGQHFLDTLDGNAPLAAPIARTGPSNALATFAVPFNPAVTPGSFAPFLRTPTSSIGLIATDPNAITPATMSWNINVQYAVKPSLILEVGYVGNRAEHIFTSEAQNVPTLASASNPLNCAGPAGCITTNTSANAVQRVPVLGIGVGAFTMGTNAGDSHYNALQATLRKTFSHGLQFQASYTFGKCISDIFGAAFFTGQGGSVNVDRGYNNLGLNRAECDYDRPQRFVLNYSYSLPNYHEDRGLTGHLLSGWVFSGVAVVQTGLPMTFTDSRGGAVFGSVGTSLAQLCPGITYGNIPTSGSVQSRLNGYFNTSAFCAPPVIGVVNGVGGATGYGNAGRAILLGPVQDNWDMALSKRTIVGGLNESAYLEFRSEAFNAFNHPQFSNPGTVVGTAAFGVITTTSVGPRVFQLALRYAF